jgi:hypothetical protein
VAVAVLTIPVADSVAVGATIVPGTAVRKARIAGSIVHVLPVDFAPKSHTMTEGLVTPSPVREVFGPVHSIGIESHTKPSGKGAKVAVVSWNVDCEGAVGSLRDIDTWYVISWFARTTPLFGPVSLPGPAAASNGDCPSAVFVIAITGVAVALGAAA